MKKLLTFFLAMIAGLTMFAQVTTSSITGKVVDKEGPLPGATIVATHVPSGSSALIATASLTIVSGGSNWDDSWDEYGDVELP